MNRKITLIMSAAAALALFARPTFAASDQSSQSTTSQNSSINSSISSSQSSSSQSGSSSTSTSSSSQSQQSSSSSSKTSSQNKQASHAKPKPTKPKHQKKLPTGWRKAGKKRYYLKKGKRLKGLHKVGKYHYLFDKYGYVMTGLRKKPHASSYVYLNRYGHQQFKNTRTSKRYYWISHTGKVTGVKNYAKTISQRPNMPTGCEITAATMMINFAGHHITKEQAARVMPRSSNPNKGFIGSPYKEYPAGYWVAPLGLRSTVKHYLGTADVMTGCSLGSLEKKLIRGHLVVVWVRWVDGFYNHALALTGYHGNTIYFNDPWTGSRRSMSRSQFFYHWRLNARRALSY